MDDHVAERHRARYKRSESVYDAVRATDREEKHEKSLWESLDKYYWEVRFTLLDHQSPTTGLFPAKSQSVSNAAKVRDSLYCAAAVWALSLAYRRSDDDKGRIHELEHSAVKCLRGILYCYMRQSLKLERYKQDPSPSTCLHSVFHVHTGDELLDYSLYGHLQIDALSLFLLYLVEMTSSGLQIIYNTDEVTFVQNLVYCVERAYRVPDFGMWERGNKYNNGSTELHASSVGLAKAALEAINGFNLFGPQGCSWSVIFVDTDAHNRNRQTLHSLLPRESRSHNTDAALLPVLGYPAFAVDDDALRHQALDKVVRKLRGRYGFRRFLRDGYRTALEEEHRRHYRPAEIKLFDGIECEFPMFYLFMVIDGVFNENQNQTQEYLALLEKVILKTSQVVMSTGHTIIPRYYHVPGEFVEGEKKEPGSQRRYPSETGHDGRLYLWGQALYVIAKLLVDGLITPQELDPVRRYVPMGDRRNVSLRYSNQGPLGTNVAVNVTIVAEGQHLQAFLNTYGIQSQTPLQMEPIQVWPQSELVKAYSYLGLNPKLGLSGRPARPIGCLGTAKTYRILGRTVVCLPVIFDLSDFYMCQDVLLLKDNIVNCLQFVSQCWKMSKRPLCLLLIREDNLKGSRFEPMMDMLADFKRGSVGGVKVRVDRIQALISGTLVQQLDFLRVSDGEELPTFSFLEEMPVKESAGLRRRLSAPCLNDSNLEGEVVEEEWGHRSSADVLHRLSECHALHNQTVLLGILLKREGGHFITNAGTVTDQLERVHSVAGTNKRWSIVRYAASLLGKVVDSLAPSITNIVVGGKQLTLGVFGHEEVAISNPVSPAAAKQLVYGTCASRDPRASALQQELVIHVGWAMANSPELFGGMLRLRIGWMIHAMNYLLELQAKGDKSVDIGVNIGAEALHGGRHKEQHGRGLMVPTMDHGGHGGLTVPGGYGGHVVHGGHGDHEPYVLSDLSPSDVKSLLLQLLQLKHHGSSGWLHRRYLDGSLNRTPPGFYDRVWQILERTPHGIVVAGTLLPQQPTLSDMTMYEMNFSLLVEEILQGIDHPAYRQLVVELLMVVSIVLERNPEVEFQEKVDLDLLLKKAVNDFEHERTKVGHVHEDALTAFYQTPPVGKCGTAVYLARAVVKMLLFGAIKPVSDDPCIIS
ncbi:phosphorylase b kinase regulatory subunit beta-like isoform X3 [Lampetra fluviatilis]